MGCVVWAQRRQAVVMGLDNKELEIARGRWECGRGARRCGWHKGVVVLRVVVAVVAVVVVAGGRCGRCGEVSGYGVGKGTSKGAFVGREHRMHHSPSGRRRKLVALSLADPRRGLVGFLSLRGGLCVVAVGPCCGRGEEAGSKQDTAIESGKPIGIQCKAYCLTLTCLC